MGSKIDWQKIYNFFTAAVCDFDCGKLCAPDNDGLPACCINKIHEPIIFADELKWLRTRTDLWQQRPALTKREKKEAEEIEDYIKYANCRGIAHCQRRFRSLTCRFFPFEPYFDEKDRFVGLTYLYRAEDSCPLIGNRKIKINQRYINQSIRVWREIMAVYPREMDLYIDESRKLRRQFKLQDRKARIFKEKSV